MQSSRLFMQFVIQLRGLPRVDRALAALKKQNAREQTLAKIFANPGEKQTEDYITGRFG